MGGLHSPRNWLFCCNRIALLIVVNSILSNPLRADVFIVGNALGSGPGSLKNQIWAANANPGADEIRFAIPGTGPHVIQPEPSLSTITDTLTIDGYSQAGASEATPTIPASLMIEIDGSTGHPYATGLSISAPACIIRGLAIGNYQQGIRIYDTNNVRIEGNHIGTDASGMVAMGFGTGAIDIVHSHDDTIGGTEAGKRNVIAGGYNPGIWIAGESTGNVVQGNYIGTNAWGKTGLGWGVAGILLSADNNTIGGPVPGARNIISGHNNEGICLYLYAHHNVIQGRRDLKFL